MSMTKKDYIRIAEPFKWRLDVIGGTGYPLSPHEVDIARHEVKVLAEQLASWFELDNPLFNRSMFLQGCGVERVKHDWNSQTMVCRNCGLEYHQANSDFCR